MLLAYILLKWFLTQGDKVSVLAHTHPRTLVIKVAIYNDQADCPSLFTLGLMSEVMCKLRKEYART